jgi:hypothetical protein
VHRGRITKQGSRLVHWAAVEAVQHISPHTRIGAHRERVAARRGRNIGVVAAARELVELVYYAMAPCAVASAPRHDQPPTKRPGAGRSLSDPAPRRARAHLIDLTRPHLPHQTPCRHRAAKE